MKCVLELACVTASMLLTGASLNAQTNSWIKATGGSWEETEGWSLGILPASSQSVMLTNAGEKTIIVNAETAQQFPASLEIQSLLISGPNTLLIDQLNADGVLQIINNNPTQNSYNLRLDSGGTLVNRESTILIGQPGIAGVTMSGLGGRIIQDGGLIELANVTFFRGEILVTNGLFKGGYFELGNNGGFHQEGGVVDMRLWLDGADYHLHDGEFAGSLNVGKSSGGTFTQSGGINHASTIVMDTPDSFSAPAADYLLNAGIIHTTNIFVGAGGSFQQNGGSTIVTNNMTLMGMVSGHGTPPSAVPATMSLFDGTFAAHSLVVDSSWGAGANLDQQDGSIWIKESVQFVGSGDPYTFIGTLKLSGGAFTCTDLISNGGAVDIIQTGGSLIVSNLLSVAGYAGKYDYHSQQEDARFVRYIMSDGTLYAGDIELLAELIIVSSGQANRVENPGAFKMGGTLRLGDATEQFGRFVLVSNALLDLGPGNAKLSFAASHAEAWNNEAMLVVTNWNGSLSGGGADQLRFGTHSSGLTTAQLNQIIFVDPVGFTPGVYAADILSTGEVVPAPKPILSFSRDSSNLVLQWTSDFVLQTATNVLGPFEELVGISSPYTNDLPSMPERYFRLRRAE